MANNKDSEIEAFESIFRSDLIDQAVAGKKKQLNVDLKNLKYISSISVRNLVLWLKDAATRLPSSQITFSGVSTHVYRQLLLISALLPESLKIQSFEVPFFCEKCEQEKQKIVTADQVLQAGDDDEAALEPMPLCDTCSAQMEPDVNLHDYFKIIRKKS